MTLNRPTTFLIAFGFLGWLMAAGAGGCSAGASAPPVSLPAPITGRLTVTSPDESGVALVIGDNGAVPADSLVHATNETQASAAFVVFPDLSTTQPDICKLAFHGCAFADADGSFEISLNASADDSIAVGILDQTTGSTISEKTSHSVPRNIRHFVRPLLDIKILSDDRKLYALMGNTLEDPNGLISVVDLATNTRNVVPFDGATPQRMAIQNETRTGVIADSAGGFLAKVDLTTDQFDAPAKQPLAAPTDLVFGTGGANLFVTSGQTGPSAMALQQVDVASLSTTAAIKDPDLAAMLPGASNIVTRSLDLLPFTGSSGTFDLIAFVGMYDVSGTTVPALGLSLSNGTNLAILAMTPLPNGADPHSVAFFRTEDSLLVTDPANDHIWIYSFTVDPVVFVGNLTLDGPVSDPSGWVVNPLRIETDRIDKLAFVNTNNETDEHPDSVLTIDLSSRSVVDSNPIGSNPTGLAYDPVDQILYSATLKSHSITFWTLPDLLP